VLGIQLCLFLFKTNLNFKYISTFQQHRGVDSHKPNFQVVYNMGDVRGLVKRLALGARSSQVEAKAFEYVRVATARLGTNALGNVGYKSKTRINVSNTGLVFNII
jgi:hypothetical protein